jgi:hypothetical protein
MYQPLLIIFSKILDLCCLTERVVLMALSAVFLSTALHSSAAHVSGAEAVTEGVVSTVLNLPYQLGLNCVAQRTPPSSNAATESYDLVVGASDGVLLCDSRTGKSIRPVIVADCSGFILTLLLLCRAQQISPEIRNHVLLAGSRPPNWHRFWKRWLARVCCH